MLQKDTNTLQQYASAVQSEWLETNGLGGWSSSTLIGCHTRRYHGLLVAATDPPTERTVLLSKLEETIVCGGQSFELGTNDYGQAVHPTGFRYTTAFSKELFPQFTYEAGGVVLRKTIGMAHDENTVFIIYDVLQAGSSFTLELLPLVAARFYHRLLQANNDINRSASFKENIFSLKAYADQPELFIKIPNARFTLTPDWFYHFNYALEKERGLDYTEDLFCYGKFEVDLQAGDTLGIVVSTENPLQKDAHILLQAETQRKQSLLQQQPMHDTLQQLLQAADQFIVQRHFTVAGKDSNAATQRVTGATVIAGYHWFTDWSRDTMISLPGLALSAGRYEDAKKILQAFAGSVSMGMLPNRFQDNGGIPEYNTVDGTLWYFVAVYKYLQATGDKAFVLAELLPVLKDIISWHYKGTRYHIHADNGLLYAGEEGQQLTWMDAKVNNWVVTPRMGKPVEVQALWYNALEITAALLQLNQETAAAAEAAADARQAKEQFNKLFWYAAGNYLYDVIDEHNLPDASVRPNQLFAISLPFALVEGAQAAAVVEKVQSELYTNVGLKSLSSMDPRYIGVYEGDRYKRDGAYHQGTVWSWLLGPFIDALVKVKGAAGRAEAKKVIENFTYHLDEACIGSVSEIFDGDAPYHPRGCAAQAWGVAELLRVIKEYRLYE